MIVSTAGKKRSMKMQRKQFTFYRSYYEAVKDLPKEDIAEIFLAVCEYALNGMEPDKLSGVPRSVFILMRPTLDSGRRKAENRSTKNTKDGDKEEQSDNKPKTNEEQTDNKPASGGEQSIKEKEKEEEREEEIEREGERENDVDVEKDFFTLEQTGTTAASSSSASQPPENIFGFDGRDLSAEMEASRTAQALIRRYGLADTEATFAALMEDIGTRGLDAVRSALEDAAASDNRGGISVRYYRAILANQGRARPAQPKSSAGPVQDGSNNPFIILARKYGAAEGGDGP